MSTNNAATQTTKSGLTRKLNNQFRKRVIEFEQGVLEMKIEAMTPDEYQGIADKLYEIQSNYEQRMEDAELEILNDLDGEIADLVQANDAQLVQAVAEMEYSQATYYGTYPILGSIKDAVTLKETTHLEWAKHAPIAELREKYQAALEDYEAPDVEPETLTALVEAGAFKTPAS